MKRNLLLYALHYDFPQAVVLLIFSALFFALFFHAFTMRKRQLAYFSEQAVLKKLLVPRSPLFFWIKACAFCLAWIGATLAFMQPKGEGDYATANSSTTENVSRNGNSAGTTIVQRPAHTVIFLIDASASMSVKDSPNGAMRLDFAKEIADEIASRLDGENGALYAFTSATMQLAPPTADYFFLRLMLRQIEINEGETAGTELAQTMQEMHARYFMHSTPILKTIILLSDGEDPQLEALPEIERQKATMKMLSLFDKSEENYLRLFTIGMGSSAGQIIPNLAFEGKPVVSSLNSKLLQDLSHAGRGHFYVANQSTATDIADDLLNKMGQDQPTLERETIRTPDGMLVRISAQASKQEVVYALYYQVPLGIALLLLVCALFLPDIRSYKKINAKEQRR